MQAEINNVAIQIVVGDITSLVVDAIVITSTPLLDLSGDIGARILQKGGPTILDECDALEPIEAGEAAITRAGTLPTKWIIHAACPRMGLGSGGERGKLASAIWQSMRLAVKYQIVTIAFSPLATGNFGYPIEACAGVMAHKIVDFTFEETGALSHIFICLEDTRTRTNFESAFLKEITSAQSEVRTRQ